jgi:hypothetical protein
MWPVAKKILLASVEGSILMSRFVLLQGAGYSVVPAYTWSEFEKGFVAEPALELLLIGESINPSLKRDMADFVAENYPRTNVIELYLHKPATKSQFTKNAKGLSSDELLKVISGALESGPFDISRAKNVGS